nr:hypothetical protein [Candidatus Sigynarchaeum springense]
MPASEYQKKRSRLIRMLMIITSINIVLEFALPLMMAMGSGVTTIIWAWGIFNTNSGMSFGITPYFLVIVGSLFNEIVTIINSREDVKSDKLILKRSIRDSNIINIVFPAIWLVFTLSFAFEQARLGIPFTMAFLIFPSILLLVVPPIVIVLVIKNKEFFYSVVKNSSRKSRIRAYIIVGIIAATLSVLWLF